MSIMRYISFPKEVSKLPLSYIKLKGEDVFNITTDAGEVLWLGNNTSLTERRVFFWDRDIDIAIFNNCFKNPFIYEFSVDMPNYYREHKMEISKKYRGKDAISLSVDHESMKRELDKYWSLEWSMQNQALCKVLHNILIADEFVEIYESWIEEEDENNWYFGPPTSETVINLEELPTLPRSTETLEFGERTKLTIHKTG